MNRAVGMPATFRHVTARSVLQRLFVDHIFTVDRTLDRLGDRAHALVVVDESVFHARVGQHAVEAGRLVPGIGNLMKAGDEPDPERDPAYPEALLDQGPMPLTI